MSRRYKKLLTYLLVLIVPFLFLFFRFDFLVPLRTKFVETTAFPLQMILYPFREVRKIFFYRQTYRQYQVLKKEVDALKSRLTGQEEVLRENSRFRNLLNLKKDFVFSSVVANVIGRDPSNWNAALIIDKGAQDGIKVNMPVIVSSGVVGKIAESGDKASKVILLNDPSFSVAALGQRTREGGLVSGTLQGLCRMKYLPPQSKIEVGDKIVTSKLSSSFPEGLLIGEVIKVEVSQSSPTVEGLIKPAVSLSTLEEVLIIQSNP